MTYTNFQPLPNFCTWISRFSTFREVQYIISICTFGIILSDKIFQHSSPLGSNSQQLKRSSNNNNNSKKHFLPIIRFLQSLWFYSFLFRFFLAIFIAKSKHIRININTNRLSTYCSAAKRRKPQQKNNKIKMSTTTMLSASTERIDQRSN